MMNISEVKYDCREFKGHIPCKPNKNHDYLCGNCPVYDPVKERILIIKLGAMGDVIRSTPLITKYKSLYPQAHITWITLTPAILPQNEIDSILKFDFTGVYTAKQFDYDIAINLDKEPEACALLKEVNAKEKYGFTWENGHAVAATKNAEHKLMTGFFDNISKVNTKSYPEEIFEICHLDFNYEPYKINFNEALAEKWTSLKDQAQGKKIIGLNTGCGKRWLTRLWPEGSWIKLIKDLQKAGHYPVVLGGPDEDALNTKYSQETGCFYPGTHSLPEFISLSSNCDLIVSQVSMMMHIAIALQKPLILMNNIFNRHEFDLYNRGEIVEPSTGCDCYYGNTCSREKRCMHDLSVDSVFNAITKYL